jgi:hypothetical protein
MPRLVRSRACCLVTALLLAVGTVGAAVDELVHGGGAHDAACVPVGDLAHDASGHAVETAPDTADRHDHCVGCHLARAPRVGAQRFSYAAHCGESAAPRPVPAIGSARAAALDNLPPRSPPPRS